MQEIGDMILQGAKAFLKRQYTTIAIISLIIAVVIGLLVGFLQGEAELEALGKGKLAIGLLTGGAFLVGAFCSAISGYIGMWVSVKCNVRCASAARYGIKGAIDVAMKGGAVSGFLIVALSLIGVSVMYFAYGGHSHPEHAPHLIVGFGFGASLVALFAQLGGGIYTKAADMGADLVGKVEAGIPEDDPRNAAVIADLVGDNVGDCAGRGADLFESTAAEMIGAMILGIVIYQITGNPAWVMFPLIVRAFGMIASMVGVMCVRGRENENPMNALNRGYFVSAGLSIIGMVLVVLFSMKEPGYGTGWLIAAGVVGIITSVIVVFVTQYYTEHRYKPVKDIAKASRTGPATNIVSGTAVGFETTLATVLTISVALLLAYFLGTKTGLVGGGVFGTAVATMGMLMTCPFILAMDTFGPITDNAAGIIEMSGTDPEVRKVTDKLDAVGNTTKALTKGYAMISAGLAAFLLFQAYLDRVALLKGEIFHTIDIARIEVFIGAFIGAMLVYLFSAWAIKAVGKTASMIIEEVRRQFRTDPGIMAGTSKPDYANCVDITAKAALRNMIAPGLLVVLAPVALGVIFRFIPDYDSPMAVGALLMVGTIGGILMASYMNNAGGAWDNAKKYIESGEFTDEQGNVIGKGTPTHAAAVVGDTVGDPFKDTAGPSLHVLVKLLATITLVLCPVFI
jgi:K(+)-stimulated pyrophosphate-energized sodium pump